MKYIAVATKLEKNEIAVGGERRTIGNVLEIPSKADWIAGQELKEEWVLLLQL